MLRIISGKYRHLKIDVPNVDTTRPTTDKVREALMSAITFDIQEKDVLDLFSGSGALGLESLSRGAKSCTFVDNNPLSYKIIKNNIKNIKISEKTEVYLQDYKTFLKNNTDKKYGLVFLDPPYKYKEVYDEIVDFLFENELYADKELRDLIYELKCNQLNNFDDNDKTNILYANKAYNQIVDIILKREEKLRKKYVKVHDFKIKKTDFSALSARIYPAFQSAYRKSVFSFT